MSFEIKNKQFFFFEAQFKAFLYHILYNTFHPLSILHSIWTTLYSSHPTKNNFPQIKNDKLPHNCQFPSSIKRLICRVKNERQVLMDWKLREALKSIYRNTKKRIKTATLLELTLFLQSGVLTIAEAHRNNEW